jgi:hypothetical protein
MSELMSFLPEKVSDPMFSYLKPRYKYFYSETDNSGFRTKLLPEQLRTKVLETIENERRLEKEKSDKEYYDYEMSDEQYEQEILQNPEDKDTWIRETTTCISGGLCMGENITHSNPEKSFWRRKTPYDLER